MDIAKVRDALRTLNGARDAHPDVERVLQDRWRAGSRARGSLPDVLPASISAAADTFTAAIASVTHNKDGVTALAAMFQEPAGDMLLAWCGASTLDRDVSLATLLVAAAGTPRLAERAATIARDRVVEGPLLDALACTALLGDGAELEKPAHAQVRARLQILFWEAGASALEVPDLGPWLWGSSDAFRLLVEEPARGSLRGRVVAARCLEVTVGGMPTDDSRGFDRNLRVLQPLLLHPEPLVWIHAARALGRLTGPFEQVQGTLLDWAQGESPVLKQRATTAVASMPARRLTALPAALLDDIIQPSKDAWVLAAVAAATPYLFRSREGWDRLARRILAGDGGAVSARALAKGLATMWRRGGRHPDVEAPLHTLREMARRAEARSLDDARRWLEIIGVTDAIEGAERDPLDLELGIENLTRMAAQYDDEEADARAERFAASLAVAFKDAYALALDPKRRLRQRAAAINAIEGCARAFALRLWSPLLTTRPGGVPVEEPDLEETWKTIARAPAELLDLVKERRRAEKRDDADDLPLEILAIRLGGYALDACGEDGDLGPGRGPTAHETCLWLRKVHGLDDGSRELPPSLENALSMMLWRLVDTTRGTALGEVDLPMGDVDVEAGLDAALDMLMGGGEPPMSAATASRGGPALRIGEVDDVKWLGPFAAWWALVIDRPAMLGRVASALPMMTPRALSVCSDKAGDLSIAVGLDIPDGEWGAQAVEAMAALNAGDTELAHALSGLAAALHRFAHASGQTPDIEGMCFDLVSAAERLRGALANPVKGLHPVSEPSIADSLSRAATENAPRVAGMVSRAIKARETGLLDVWFASLGPVTSALVEPAVRKAISRTPPPPPKPKKPTPQVIEGYELIKPLGEGAMGKVWLVRRPGADRFFVLKIPKKEALQNATEEERAGILASFVEEARALAGLYHPNVANIIDRGVSNGVPFLVLELLIGADLKHYSEARRMSLFELRQIVLEACAGLAALHSAGLVHRDVKPANLWLRLNLAGGGPFDGAKHRDPAVTHPLATVVIDFGMVRAIRVPKDLCGRFVAGTAGYIAPEQVMDPVELHPNADVYALAGAIYNVHTGRAFFDDLDNPLDRIRAHMQKDPFEDPERLRGFPATMAKLLRQATSMQPGERPSPLEFGRAFAASL